MKRNKATTLKWAWLGSIAGVAACVGAMYKAVANRIQQRFENHQQEVALQTFEGEGGLVLD